MINLVSDTVTKPTQGMLEYMIKAEVGDDVFGEDPSVNELERKMSALFGYEKSLFVPSGTMANQIALKVHTQPLDEIICDKLSHIYKYELGGYGFHSGAAIHLIDGQGGKITARQVEASIKPDVDWYPNSRLVSLENSINMAGGNYYTISEIEPIHDVCQQHGLRLHLDGARLFNVLVETGEKPTAYGKLFDSISICFSKGLGAPVGSVLMGSNDIIKKARKIRKAMGGGMRQAGFLAAACIYALDHQVDRLKEDHDHARQIADVLKATRYVQSVLPVKTNIIICTVEDISADAFVSVLAKEGVKVAAISTNTVRFVLHLDVNKVMVAKTINILQSL